MSESESDEVVVSESSDNECDDDDSLDEDYGGDNSCDEGGDNDGDDDGDWNEQEGSSSAEEGAGGRRKQGNGKAATKSAATKAAATKTAAAKRVQRGASGVRSVGRRAREAKSEGSGDEEPSVAAMKAANVAAVLRGDVEVCRRALLPRMLSVSQDAAVLRRPFKSPCPGATTNASPELLRRLAACRRFVAWGGGVHRRPLVMAPAGDQGEGEDAEDGEAEKGEEEAQAVAAAEAGYEPLVLWVPEEDPFHACEQSQPIAVDPILAKCLRAHQREGVAFMFECVAGLKDFHQQGDDDPGCYGCILADDMGLGKTLQSIALLWTLLKQGFQGPKGPPLVRRALIVTPTSLVSNWAAELDKWLGGRVRCVALCEASRAEALKGIQQFLAPRGMHHVLIVSYETFRLHATAFQHEGACDLVICDEAHRLKNDRTLTTKVAAHATQALAGLPCRRRVLLSGTPMQNDLEEFYAMVSFTNPGVLSNAAHFRRHFQVPPPPRPTSSSALHYQLARFYSPSAPLLFPNCLLPCCTHPMLAISESSRVVPRLLSHSISHRPRVSHPLPALPPLSTTSSHHPWWHAQAPILAGREPHASEEERALGAERSAELSDRVNQFILRRTNALLSNHLPPKVCSSVLPPPLGLSPTLHLTSTTSFYTSFYLHVTPNLSCGCIVEIVCCRMTDLQRQLYERFMHSKNVRTALEDGKKARALASITALKKLCNHPKLLYDSIRAGGAEAAGFEDALPLFPPEMFNGRSGTWTGGGGTWVQLSGKMVVLARLLAHLRTHTTDRIVLVSNYTQTLDLFAQLCREHGYPFMRLDGGTSVGKRQKLVQQFNDPHADEFVFLLSSKAGGCGLNLIGGNRLVLFDPDWNPANDKQAAARVWRDGQKKRVFVYRFLAAGTIEEKVFQRQMAKEGLQQVVDSEKQSEGRAQVNLLSAEELRDLFMLRSSTLSVPSCRSLPSHALLPSPHTHCCSAWVILSDTHDSLGCQRCPSRPSLHAAGRGGCHVGGQHKGGQGVGREGAGGGGKGAKMERRGGGSLEELAAAAAGEGEGAGQGEGGGVRGGEEGGDREEGSSGVESGGREKAEAEGSDEEDVQAGRASSGGGKGEGESDIGGFAEVAGVAGKLKEWEKQVGNPLEEQLDQWAHHSRPSATIPDTALQKAACLDVTFVFSCQIRGMLAPIDSAPPPSTRPSHRPLSRLPTRLPLRPAAAVGAGMAAAGRLGGGALGGRGRFGMRGQGWAVGARQLGGQPKVCAEMGGVVGRRRGSSEGRRGVGYYAGEAGVELKEQAPEMHPLIWSAKSGPFFVPTRPILLVHAPPYCFSGSLLATSLARHHTIMRLISQTSQSLQSGVRPDLSRDSVAGTTHRQSPSCLAALRPLSSNLSLTDHRPQRANARLVPAAQLAHHVSPADAATHRARCSRGPVDAGAGELGAGAFTAGAGGFRSRCWPFIAPCRAADLNGALCAERGSAALRQACTRGRPRTRRPHSHRLRVQAVAVERRAPAAGATDSGLHWPLAGGRSGGLGSGAGRSGRRDGGVSSGRSGKRRERLPFLSPPRDDDARAGDNADLRKQIVQSAPRATVDELASASQVSARVIGVLGSSNVRASSPSRHSFPPLVVSLSHLSPQSPRFPPPSHLPNPARAQMARLSALVYHRDPTPHVSALGLTLRACQQTPFTAYMVVDSPPCPREGGRTRYVIARGVAVDRSEVDVGRLWRQLLQVRPVHLERALTPPGVELLVHGGVHAIAEDVYRGVLPLLAADMRREGITHLRFGGHSLGGSLALLLMLMFHLRAPNTRADASPLHLSAHTFGSFPVLASLSSSPSPSAPQSLSHQFAHAPSDLSRLLASAHAHPSSPLLHRAAGRPPTAHTTASWPHMASPHLHAPPPGLLSFPHAPLLHPSSPFSSSSRGAARCSVLASLGLPSEAARAFVLDRDIIPRAFLLAHPLCSAFARTPLLRSLLGLHPSTSAPPLSTGLSWDPMAFQAVGLVHYMQATGSESMVASLPPALAEKALAMGVGELVRDPLMLARSIRDHCFNHYVHFLELRGTPHEHSPHAAFLCAAAPLSLSRLSPFAHLSQDSVAQDGAVACLDDGEQAPPGKAAISAARDGPAAPAVATNNGAEAPPRALFHPIKVGRRGFFNHPLLTPFAESRTSIPRSRIMPRPAVLPTSALSSLRALVASQVDDMHAEMDRLRLELWAARIECSELRAQLEVRQATLPCRAVQSLVGPAVIITPVTAFRPPASPLRPSLVTLSTPPPHLPASHPSAARGVQARSERALEEERLAGARSAREEAQRQVEEARGEAAAARREAERARRYHEEEVAVLLGAHRDKEALWQRKEVELEHELRHLRHRLADARN
ncbi:unnamed protein product, partial [Closterium sp. NIES-65]